MVNDARIHTVIVRDDECKVEDHWWYGRETSVAGRKGDYADSVDAAWCSGDT